MLLFQNCTRFQLLPYNTTDIYIVIAPNFTHFHFKILIVIFPIVVRQQLQKAQADTHALPSTRPRVRPQPPAGRAPQHPWAGGGEPTDTIEPSTARRRPRRLPPTRVSLNLKLGRRRPRPPRFTTDIEHIKQVWD